MQMQLSKFQKTTSMCLSFVIFKMVMLIRVSTSSTSVRLNWENVFETSWPSPLPARCKGHNTCWFLFLLSFYTISHLPLQSDEKWLALNKIFSRNMLLKKKVILIQPFKIESLLYRLSKVCFVPSKWSPPHVSVLRFLE